MLFHTPEFLMLLLLALPLYWLFPKGRLFIIGIANILFYGWAGIGYLFLFFVIVLISYLFSFIIFKTENKVYLWIILTINIANLVFFKYFSFLLENIERLTKVNLVSQGSLFTQIILPIGISFYTFQLIAYLVDVSNKKIQPASSFLEFWVFISFFGQLVAGPIMRGQDFMPQIGEAKKFDFNPSYFKYGVYLVLMGLAKKILIADQVAVWVNEYFAHPTNLSLVQAWAGAYLFGFQIYADFSGYSDIALGLGYLFGFKLALNFRTPYLSKNPTEFWHRWHITLSNWIRDYVYIPLGGSHNNRTAINLILAFLISGLWHGAAWTFVIWGGIHGAFLVIHRAFSERFRRPTGKFISTVSIILTFHLTTLAWVFFRANGLRQATVYFSQMFQKTTLSGVLADVRILAIVSILFIAHIFEALIRENEQRLSAVFNIVPAPVRGLCYVLIVVILIGLLPTQKQEFIYFQF